MTVAVRAERRRAVVHVQRPQPVEPDARVEIRHERVDRGRVGDVVARHVEVARVEADAEARVVFQTLEEDVQLFERAADRPACARRVLHQQPGVALAALQDAGECGARPLETRLEAGAEVRADVEDDAVRLDRARSVDGVAHRLDRLLVDLLVRCGQVAQVERVADDAADTRLAPAGLEPFDRFGLVVGRPPHPRALGEDLHAVAADRLDAVDRLVDPTAGGHVRSEFHGHLR